jgi:hypothetical protein
MAVPAFGAEGIDGCISATKVREDQNKVRSTGEMSRKVWRNQGRIAASVPKVRRS